MFLNHFEVPDNDSYYFFREHVAPLLELPLPTYGALLPLALVGMLLARRDRRAQLPILFFLGDLAGTVLFFNISRLRIAVVPVVIVFAASGALALFDALRARRWRRVLAFAGALAIAYPLVFQDISSDNFAIYHFNLGARRAELARSAEGEAAAALWDEAERDFRRGLELRPDSALLARELRRLLVLRVEQLERAGAYEQALARAQDLRASFPALPDGYALMGAQYRNLGREEQARAALRQALRLAPEHPRALRELERLDSPR
jgi:tetratricopeptide (TPR) repeat protein